MVIPPDGLKRTAWGVFPCWRRFDNNSAVPVNNPSLGATGAGIYSSNYRWQLMLTFMLAESALDSWYSG